MIETDERGLLPIGIHDASVEEIQNCFGSFQRSDRRCRLFERLAEFISELRKSKIPGHVIVDGSFVMKCVDEPSDIDLVLVVDRQWSFERRFATISIQLGRETRD